MSSCLSWRDQQKFVENLGIARFISFSSCFLLFSSFSLPLAENSIVPFRVAISLNPWRQQRLGSLVKDLDLITLANSMHAI